MIAAFLSHWFHYFYIPAGEPWYHGNVWGNLFVVAVIFPLGWLWSRTKFWPLRPLRHGIEGLHAKVDAFRKEHQEAHVALHRRMDQHDDSLEALHTKLNRLLESKPKRSGRAVE